MIIKVLFLLYSWIILVVLVIIVIIVNLFYVVSILNDFFVLEVWLFIMNCVINVVNCFYVVVFCVEFGQCGYMLIGDEEYFIDYIEMLSVIGELMDEVEVSFFFLDINDQLICIEKFLFLIKVKVNEVIEVVELYKEGKE